MKIAFNSKTAAFYAGACALLFCLPQLAHAQSTNIGAGMLKFSIDNQEVENGYPGNVTGLTVPLGQMLTGTVEVGGVTGNNGTTYVYCDDSVQGQIFSWSTQVSAQTTFQWTPKNQQSPHYLYCSANYGGTYANGSVSTPNIEIPVNP